MPNSRSTLRRIPQRGTRDPTVIHDILDRSLLCQVGIATEGQPFVLPMTFARREDQLILHGSTASRLMRALSEGAEACGSAALASETRFSAKKIHQSPAKA